MVTTTNRLASYRELLRSFVRRDLTARYRGSALGFLWTFLNPLMMLLVYWFLFKVVSRGADTGKSYAVFLFAGFLPWTFLTNALIQATGSIKNNGNLVKKVFFPNEILPLSAIISAFISFLFTLLLLVPLLVGFSYPWLTINLLLLPSLFLLLLGFAVGLGLLLATATVFFRDIEHIIGVVLSAWFFLTPILYPDSFLNSLLGHQSRLLIVVLLNPLTGWFVTYRSILLNGRLPTVPYAAPSLVYMVAATVVFVAVGILTFNRLKYRFEEEL
jgi:ABC-2 type transport system permease protein